MDTPRSPYYSIPPQFSRPPQNMSAHAVKVPHVMPTNTMMWPVGANGKPKPKPKRPYTAYNLFYLLERELVVQKINGPPKSSGIKRRYAGMPPREEDQIKPPSRYEKIIMAPYWYDPNMKEKRKHRKTPGMVSSIVFYRLRFFYLAYRHKGLTPLFLQITDFVQGANWNNLS